MADYISNLLILETKDMERLQRIRYVFIDYSNRDAPVLSLNKIIPQSPAMLYAQEKGYMNDELEFWRYANWGVKWDVVNEYGGRISPANHLYFVSAWNVPIPAIKKLSEICKDIPMTLYSAVEHVGSRASIIKLLNGEEVSSENFNGTNESYEIYLKTRKLTFENCDYIHKDDNGNYYFDDDE